MCRNIRTLANFEPPATDDEIRASAVQFVRKLSGTARPSRQNDAAFRERVKARERNLKRFGRAASVFDHQPEQSQ